MTPPVGPKPTCIVCTNCHQQVTTHIKAKITAKTHMCAFLMCLTMCWPCVACLYCMDCAKNKDHYCPSCNQYLGTYKV
ncbi:hypothetical protein KR018_000507 [Drosophila ironensis]|nr:hypothetical protein KR018_000507 [Drosophila ironensis]